MGLLIELIFLKVERYPKKVNYLIDCLVTQGIGWIVAPEFYELIEQISSLLRGLFCQFLGAKKRHPQEKLREQNLPRPHGGPKFPRSQELHRRNGRQPPVRFYSSKWLQEVAVPRETDFFKRFPISSSKCFGGSPIPGRIRRISSGDINAPAGRSRTK